MFNLDIVNECVFCQNETNWWIQLYFVVIFREKMTINYIWK